MDRYARHELSHSCFLKLASLFFQKTFQVGAHRPVVTLPPKSCSTWPHRGRFASAAITAWETVSSLGACQPEVAPSPGQHAADASTFRMFNAILCLGQSSVHPARDLREVQLNSMGSRFRWVEISDGFDFKVPPLPCGPCWHSAVTQTWTSKFAIDGG